MSNSDGDERKNDGGEGPVEKGNEPKRAGRVRFWPLMFFLLVCGAATAPFYRSEERRVGKECSS